MKHLTEINTESCLFKHTFSNKNKHEFNLIFASCVSSLKFLVNLKIFYPGLAHQADHQDPEHAVQQVAGKERQAEAAASAAVRGSPHRASVLRSNAGCESDTKPLKVNYKVCAMNDIYYLAIKLISGCLSAYYVSAIFLWTFVN